MSQLTIEIDTDENEQLLLALLPKLGGRVVAKRQPSSESFADVAERIAAKGGLPSFGDGSEWQREERSWDRVLPGREG